MFPKYFFLFAYQSSFTFYFNLLRRPFPFLPFSTSSFMSEQLSISISELIEKAPAILSLEVIAGAKGVETHSLTSARIQKLGLALAGFMHYIHLGRLQFVGQSEIWYLEQLGYERKQEAINNLALDKITCILVTKDLKPPEELLEICNRENIPLLRTPLVSSQAINTIVGFLQEELAPRSTRHGVLLDLYGLGVLLLGESGLGKSECALDLIAKGHRLVSDDSVELKKIGSDKIIGCAPELLREHLEIRGLGIINIRELFSVSAISDSKEISVCIRFERWDEKNEVERLGIDGRTLDILGVEIPLFVIPVSPGRNLATLVETAARVHLLRVRGYDAARALVEKHTKLLEEQE
jgi:HPr kinase/phosphorylase